MPPRPLAQALRRRFIVPLGCALIALMPALSPAFAQTSAAPAAKPSSAPAATAPASPPPSAKAAPAPTTPAKAPASAPKTGAPPAPVPHSSAPHPLAKKEAPASPPAPAKAPAKPPVVVLTPAEEVKKTFKDKITPFIKTYCFECHGDRKMKGGVNFAPALKNPSDPAHTRRWKMGLATVNAHDMPPDDADKQPTDTEREEFMAWVGRLKYLSPQDPGAFVIRRLTKTEYGNTLQDLLGVSPDIVKELPDEVPGEGYLNTLSPLQMEQYLGIANEALRLAIPPRHGPATPTQMEVRQRLFSLPSAPTMDSTPAEVRTAARQVAQKIARQAYRRPATAQEVDVLMQVYDLATQNKLSHEDALTFMLKAALVSPQFLYITPASTTITSSSSSTATTTGQGTPPAPEIVPLDDWMLASRLSYFLWATMPDAELSTLADQGQLHDPAILRTQVQRMLSDDRSRALFDGFGAQWLGLADLADKTFDTTKFPQMTPALRQAMYDEARLFFTSIIRDNAPTSTFITADYTYLNEPLATLYGLDSKSPAGVKSSADAQNKSSSSPNSGIANSTPNSPNSPNSSPHSLAPNSLANNSPVTNPPTANSTTNSAATAATAPSQRAGLPELPSATSSTPAITGPNLRRVKLPDANRGGILGMPGILAATSFPNRTSPVRRGVWVLEQILGEHIPPAPPNVPTLEKQDKNKVANLTLRQRTELHRTNVVCANCHKILDPIGFGLENFDAIGRWRAQDDTGGPIDAAGELPGGKRFTTPAQLKAIIAARKDDLTRNLTEKLLAYALCRQLEGYDEIIIDQLMQGIAKDNHRLQTLITSVVTSYPFLNRRVVETLSATPAPKK